MLQRTLASFLFLLLASSVMSGCGYTLQTSKGSTLVDEGVERIYVAPLQNKSYKPGVENLVYNELLQVLAAGRRMRLVQKPEYSDAILEGEVTVASYKPSATTPSDNIYNQNTTTISIPVATEYVASVTCHFQLRRVKARPGFLHKSKLTAKDLEKDQSIVWGGSFSKDRRFPGNNQKGEFGTTSALINESEFDRTLQQIIHGMMQEVHESMFAMF